MTAALMVLKRSVSFLFSRNSSLLVGGLQLRALLRLCLGVGDAEEGSLLYFVLAFQLRIGGNQLGFADAVFAADAEYGFFPLHFMHVTAS